MTEGAALPTRARWKRGRTRRLMHRHRLGLFGLVVLLLIVFAAVSAPLIAPYDPNRQNYGAILRGPSATHWLGTDQFGRDLLSRIIFGARVSLGAGFSAVGFAVLAGTFLGLLAGYHGSRLDEVIMRFMDALYAYPALLLALVLAAVLGSGIGNIVVAIGVVYTPIFARLVRGSTLSVRTRDYVMAATALGASDWRIIGQHILPNVMMPIVVQASLSVSFAVIAEASLSFLGVGVQPPTSSWGEMLRTGYGYLEIAPWLSIFPGLVIFCTVLSLNVCGDALRDILDPRIRGDDH